MTQIRNLALVVEIDEYANDKQYSLSNLGIEDKTFIFMGEIPNMEGHVVLAGYETGKIYVGFHNDRFRELNLEKEDIRLKERKNKSADIIPDWGY